MTDSYAPNSREMFQWIEDIFNLGPRRPGTAPDLAGEDYLATKLVEAGLSDVRKEPIPIRVWEADKHSFSIVNPYGTVEEIPSFYIPYTQFTPEQGVRGRLVYVPDNIVTLSLADSWKGKIVVTDIEFPQLDTRLLEKIGFFTYDPDGNIEETSHAASWIRLHWKIYNEAVKRGAAGFIGILKDHYCDGQRHYAPYGFKEKDIHDKPVPGFWIDRTQGEKIRRLARDGKTMGELVLTGNLKDGYTHNVIGEIKGKSSEVFLIGCHHDSPFSSAVEDASGCSVILAAAKHLAASPIKLRRTVMVCFSAGHFYGSIGTRTFIERARQSGLLDRIALEYHVEHIALEAVEGPEGRLVTLARPEPTGAFVSFNRRIRQALIDAVTQENLTRLVGLPPEGVFGPFPPTDGGDYYEAGVPVINMIGNPMYLLNAEDTLDKVAIDRLAPTARAVVKVLNDLDGVSLKKLRANHFPVQTEIMHVVSKAVSMLARV